MKTVVSLSFRPDLDDERRDQLVDRVGRLLAYHSDGRPGAARVLEDSGQQDRRLVAVSHWTQADFAASSDEFVIPLTVEPYLALGPVVEGHDLLGLLARQSNEVFADFSAPFGFCYSRPGSDRIEWVTDIVGLQHLYHFVGDGWAAASTSGRLLGHLGGSPLDAEALCTFGLTGYHLADRTPWLGVRKLMDGCVLTLVGGTIEVERYANARLDWQPDSAPGDLVAEGADLVTELVENACRVHNDPPTLELSGGIDSRCLLAAMSPARRAKTTMLTLGTPGTADWDIAALIAKDFGLHHRQVDLAGLRELDPEEAWALVQASALRFEVSGNVVANAVLMWVEGQVGQGPRLNGQSAEYGRGRFYPGQRNARNTDERVRRLATWRIFANQAVSSRILVPEVLAKTRSDAIRALQDEFHRYSDNWLQATDDHFLFGLNQRWLGVHLSAADQDRPVLSPFLTKAYIEWARRIPLDVKRSSKLFSAVIERLDPRLATYPLAMGLTPQQLARGGLGAKMRLGTRFVQGSGHKLRQRLLPGTDKPSVGSPALAQAVVSYWRANPETLSPVEQFFFIDGKGIAAILDGTLTPSVVTVEFLANLLALVALNDDDSAAPTRK